MTIEGRLNLLRRRILSQTGFAGAVAQEMEAAAQEGRAGDACFLAQAFVACCLELTHSLWPGGKRLIDALAVGVAPALRERLRVEPDSPLAVETMTLLGAAIQHTQQDCRETMDLAGLALSINGTRYELRPLIREVEWLYRVSQPAGDARAPVR